jgi:hypothetical protein
MLAGLRSDRCRHGNKEIYHITAEKSKTSGGIRLPAAWPVHRLLGAVRKTVDNRPAGWYPFSDCEFRPTPGLASREDDDGD